MRTLLTDAKEATRSLRKAPRFTIVAALTLALGVGAVTSIFSVVNGVLLRPLPYPEPDRLVNVWSSAPGLGYDQFQLSPDLFFFYREHATVFEDVSLFQRRRANLTEDGDPDVIDVAVTDEAYFRTLDATPVPGRAYAIEEDRPDAPRVVVLGHAFWAERYGADPSLVGRAIRLDGEPTQVIGIAPAWLDPDNPPSGSFSWSVIGRLKPGVRPEEAASHLEPIVQLALDEYIGPLDTYRAFITDGGYRPLVHDMKEDIVGSAREPLWILLGTVGFVLLIACANVANLFLIRAEGRQREVAVRTALGAGRLALVRKLLTEAVVLAILGGGLGLVLSASALPALLRLAPSSIPRLDQVTLDLTVVAFTVGVVAISAVLFGLVPALRYTGLSALGALRHGGRGGTEDRARTRGRNLLVVTQTALALVLLVGSGLLVRSFARMLDTDLGFETDRMLTFRVALPPASYPDPVDAAAFTGRLVARLDELPMVERAGAASVLPVESNAPGTAHQIDGRPTPPGELPPMIHYKTVTPGYFETMGIPVVSGRDLTSGDVQADTRVVVVNQALADLYWPEADALGKRLRQGSDANPGDWYTVVGVVGSVLQDGLREDPRPLAYYPLSGVNLGGSRVMTYVVRGPGVLTSAEAVRRAVWALDGDLPVAAMRSMDEIVDRSIVQFSFTMLTLGIAAVIALVLGAVGLYGVLAYAVSLRTREIGVRLALGAPRSRVMQTVVLNGLAISAIGLVVGLLGAVGLTRLLEGILYETEPLDLATFAGMSGVLFVVALAASVLPARRAAAVSPLEAMRTE
jgi:putative ABC transport system permease protein